MEHRLASCGSVGTSRRKPSRVVLVPSFSTLLRSRNLTLRECARLQTFPDTFLFAGTFTERIQLIGDAVPPRLAFGIARSLHKDLQVAAPTSSPGKLLSFVPTLSKGMSPALERVTGRVLSTLAPRQQAAGTTGATMRLTQAQRVIVEKARALGGGRQGVALDDSVCTYLVGTIATDLGLLVYFPEFRAGLAPFFGSEPLDSLRLSNQDFLALFERLVTLEPNADTYFSCLATLHKSRAEV